MYSTPSAIVAGSIDSSSIAVNSRLMTFFMVTSSF